MTSLQAWLSKPRTTVRIDRVAPWAAWMKVLRRRFNRRHADSCPRIEVLDRLSLGGKKSLLLVAIEGRRLLIGVGDNAAPSISALDEMKRVTSSRLSSRSIRTFHGRRMARP
jgi:flagellar biogenesis protein FliO